MANEEQNQDNSQDQGDVQQSAVKDPGDWATGDEPVTGPQLSYLQTLATEAGEEDTSWLTEDLTKAQASEHINRLQAATGRKGGTGTESV